MGMIVQHNLTAMNTNRQLGISASTLAKSTEKLSSGYRINRAADDAAGLAISEKMRSQIRGLNKASDNAADGISLLQTAEGALAESHSILQRMRELCVQASNGTETDDDRGNIQDEIEQLQEELDRIASDTEFNTMNLLDGSLSAASSAVSNAGPKYGTYDANMKAFVTSNVEGVGVIINNSASKGGESGIWSADGKTLTLNLVRNSTYSQSEIDDLIKNAKQEDSTATGTPADVSVNLYYSSLTATDEVSTATQVAPGVPSTTTVAGVRASSSGNTMVSTMATEKARIEANSPAAGPTDTVYSVYDENNGIGVVTNQEDLTVKIAYAATENAVFNAANAGVNPPTPNTLTLTLENDKEYSQDDINKLIRTEYYGANNKLVPDARGGAAFYITLDKPLNTDGTNATKTFDFSNPKGVENGKYADWDGETIANAANTVGETKINFTSKKYGEDYNIKLVVAFDAAQGKEVCEETTAATYTTEGELDTPGRYTLHLQSGKEYTETDLESILSAAGLNLDVDFSGPNPDEPNTIFVTDGNAKQLFILNGGAGLGDDNAYLGQPLYDAAGGGSGITLQVGANEGQTLSFAIGDMSATALGVNESNVNVSTQRGAQESISKIDEAVAVVSKQRALIGAVQNRLEHTISNLDNTAENLQSAESTVRDVDMAEEMVTYSKYNILQQAGQSMLAQANQSTQGVLSLIQG